MAIRPDVKRRVDDPQFVMAIDINRVDSGRSWLKSDANVLYGWYTGMAYLLPIIGGLIADKLIGTHRSMVVGGLIIALGHIVLWCSGLGGLSLENKGMTLFVMGMALITIGTGHFKPSVSVSTASTSRRSPSQVLNARASSTESTRWSWTSARPLIASWRPW